MKKNLALRGLLSVLLMAGMMFTACPMNDDDDGGPKPENLPDLPAGTNYAVSESEAKALLDELNLVVSPVWNQVSLVIRDAEDESGNYNITGDVSIPGLKITAKESYTFNANPDNFGQNGWGPLVGDTAQESGNAEITIDFTADKAVSGVTVYQGSRSENKYRFTDKYEVKSVSAEKTTVNVNRSIDVSYVYTLTASSGGKGGKIILDTGYKASANGNIDLSSGDIEPHYTYSGSLEVFGASNEAIYTLPITNEATFQQAMDYF